MIGGNYSTATSAPQEAASLPTGNGTFGAGAGQASANVPTAGYMRDAPGPQVKPMHARVRQPKD